MEKENLVTKLAGILHDDWRKDRYDKNTETYEPRWKKTNDEAWIAENATEDNLAYRREDDQHQLDIANLSYTGLSSEWQAENKAAAEGAIDLVYSAAKQGHALDDDFVKEAASDIHEQWKNRNTWAEGSELWASYKNLSPEEQAKDDAIVKMAIRLYSSE